MQLCLFVVFLVLLTSRSSSGTDLMLQVDAGREECFFESAQLNRTLFVDYSVVGTNQGELDINFQISDTQSRPLITEFRRTESHHEIPIKFPGLYKICFDNTFSHFSHKTVAFTITMESQDETNWKDYDENNFQPDGVLDMQVNDIKHIMERVKIALNKVSGVQDNFRILELKDRSIAESNFERVNYWSFVNLLVLAGVGVVQVVVVKSLFDEQSNVRKLMKKMKG